jgi:hypothetical protein
MNHQTEVVRLTVLQQIEEMARDANVHSILDAKQLLRQIARKARNAIKGKII